MQSCLTVLALAIDEVVGLVRKLTQELCDFHTLLLVQYFNSVVQQCKVFILLVSVIQ